MNSHEDPSTSSAGRGAAATESTAARDKERTLRYACLLSLWAPLAGTVTYLIGRSVTLLADLLRRTSELAVLLAAWWLARQVATGRLLPDSPRRMRLETITSRSIVAIMLLAFVVSTGSGIGRLVYPKPVGQVLAGLLVAVAGGLVNFWFWQRSHRLARQEPTPVIEAQWRLYRAKTAADALVVATLTAAMLWKKQSWSVYLDPAGSISVGLFMLFSAYRAWRTALHQTFLPDA
ncbi:MAG TPA: cation transporter [Firmicutes bacterium]|nr:cation transporter [Bacillota bacterium]